jgi:uncharacterized protein YeaO (DUF488 family)
MAKVDIRIKRVYEPAAKGDGLRVLVDRLWPRGLRKEEAALGEWMKEIAPSDALRKKFHGNPDKWDEFRRKYFAELKDNPLIGELVKKARPGRVTLVYAAKDEEKNNAVALREYLLKRLKR